MNNIRIRKIKNNIDYEGHKPQSFFFSKKSGEKFTRNEMKKIANNFKKEVREEHENGLVSLTIEYPDKNYSGQVSYLNQPINFFTMDDYDNFAEEPGEYNSFIFTFIPLPAAEGGSDDEDNDCLIKCIRKVIRTKKNDIIADELKENLNVKRDGKIPLNKMNLVEDYIFVSFSSPASILSLCV